MHVNGFIGTIKKRLWYASGIQDILKFLIFLWQFTSISKII